MVKAKTLRCAAIAVACIPVVLHAQAPAVKRPAYTLERYDEDWTFLRDKSKRTDFFDPIKFIPFGKGTSSYLTLGGELRERYQDTRNPAFGLPSPVRDTDFYHRTYLFGDVHLGHFRTFLELVNGEILGTTKKPSTFEQDRLDILQVFADVVIPLRKSQDLTLRLGREDMIFGSSRLVSLREAPNVRRTFDGGRIFWKAGKGKRVDAFLVRPVIPEYGVFDDTTDLTQLFWGVYSTTPVRHVKGFNADVYYFGLNKKDAPFAQAVARERRHTVGVRLFGQRTAIDRDEEQFNFDSRRRPPDVESKYDWDVEGAYQFGSFGSAGISAWLISSNWGFTFSELRFSPRLGLKADAASGDHNLHDNRLGTFNPLYPALRYYSLVRLFEPANLLNLQPNITVDLATGVSLNVAWSELWRESAADAFYAPPLVPVKGTITSARFLGQQISAIGAWKATSHLSIYGDYAHFRPGGSVRDVGGRSGDFVLAIAQFKF